MIDLYFQKNKVKKYSIRQFEDSLNHSLISEYSEKHLETLDDISKKIILILKLNGHSKTNDLINFISDDKSSLKNAKEFLKNNLCINNVKLFLILLLRHEKYNTINDLKINLKKHYELNYTFSSIELILTAH